MCIQVWYKCIYTCTYRDVPNSSWLQTGRHHFHILPQKLSRPWTISSPNWIILHIYVLYFQLSLLEVPHKTLPRYSVLHSGVNWDLGWINYNKFTGDRRPSNISAWWSRCFPTIGYCYHWIIPWDNDTHEAANRPSKGHGCFLNELFVPVDMLVASAIGNSLPSSEPFVSMSSVLSPSTSSP